MAERYHGAINQDLLNRELERDIQRTIESHLTDGLNLPPGDGRSDGSTAHYYELPEGATELQHLISYKNLNAQIGEIFRACYRYGQASHSDKLRDAKKMKFYADAEIERLEKYESYGRD